MFSGRVTRRTECHISSIDNVHTYTVLDDDSGIVRFGNGSYEGSFTGSVSLGKLIVNRAVRGDMAFSVLNAILAVTKPGTGTGTIAATGLSSSVARPTVTELRSMGLSIPAGATLSNVVMKFQQVSSGLNTWTISGQITVPNLGTQTLTGTGIWTALRVQ